MEWPGPGRDCAHIGIVYLEASERLWGLEMFQRGRGSLGHLWQKIHESIVMDLCQVRLNEGEGCHGKSSLLALSFGCGNPPSEL